MVKLIRYIGLEELQALAKDKYIKPKFIHHGLSKGAGKPIIYFFPRYSKDLPEDFLEQSEERWLYLTGIIEENKLKDKSYYLIAVEVNLSEDRITRGTGEYSNPQSLDVFDFQLMEVEEYYSQEYKLEDVEKVYFIQTDVLGLDFIKTGTVQEILTYIDERNK